MKPHERMDEWLKKKGYVEIELMIEYCQYNRSWASSEVQAARRWVYGHSTKCKNRTAWKRFFSNWLSRGWESLPTDQKITERDYDRPPGI